MYRKPWEQYSTQAVHISIIRGSTVQVVHRQYTSGALLAVLVSHVRVGLRLDCMIKAAWRFKKAVPCRVHEDQLYKLYWRVTPPKTIRGTRVCGYMASEY
jgi:hypothetical protein